MLLCENLHNLIHWFHDILAFYAYAIYETVSIRWRQRRLALCVYHQISRFAKEKEKETKVHSLWLKRFNFIYFWLDMREISIWFSDLTRKEPIINWKLMKISNSMILIKHKKPLNLYLK